MGSPKRHEASSASIARQIDPDGEVPLLRIDGLSVAFDEHHDRPAIENMDLTVRQGEILALVGESGSGKTLTALAVMGLLPANASVVGGHVWLAGEDMADMSPHRRDEVRGNTVAMLFQQPKAMLDPTDRIGNQIVEALRQHRKVSRREARAKAVELLRDVGIPEPSRRVASYSHQLSGGMAQRVMIAAAMSADPALLVADEPTTALDVTVQAQILALLKKKREERGLAILLITHDFGIVASVADRIAVMYTGRIIEQGPAADILANPKHPYTAGLVRSSLLEADRGRLFSIAGNIAYAPMLDHGCRFLPRCQRAGELGISDWCREVEPQLGSDAIHTARCHAPFGTGRRS